MTISSDDHIFALSAPLTAPGSNRKSLVKHAIILILVGLLWGLQPPVIKLLTQDGAPEVATLGALLAGIAIILGAVMIFNRHPIRNAGAKLPFMAINGASEYAIPLLLTFVVSRHIDAGLLTLIFSTTPIFTVSVAALSRTERLNMASVMACIFGLLAFLALVIPQDALPSREMLPWCLAAFGIPLSYATGSVYVSRKWPADMDPLQVAFSGALFASLFISPFWVGPVVQGNLFDTSPSGLAIFAFLVALTIAEMGLYYYLLRNAGPVFTSFSSFIMIISGFISGALLFGESPTMWIWISVGLFAAALAFVVGGHKKASAH